MSPTFGPFFWGVMAAILMDLCAPDGMRWYFRWPLRVFLYCACAAAVDRLYFVVAL